jgi:hypothetical protein
MSLATFCDLVWVEIWDDVGPMSDHTQYRRIVTELFIEGKDPYDITYETTVYDKKGKAKQVVKRLSEMPSGAARSQRLVSQADVLAEWKARAAELKAAKQAAEAKKT